MHSTGIIACRNLLIEPLAACLMAALAIADSSCTAAAAATLPVTNCNDAGSGSLRAALGVAHNGDSVDLTALTCGTISLATGELSIAVDNLVLQGPGASSLTIAGGPATGNAYADVLHHTGHGTLRIDALRVTDTHIGSVYTDLTRCIDSSGHVELNRSTVTECRRGAILANAFSARDSTISNSSRGIQTTGGSVAIDSSTISGNFNYEPCVGLHIGIRGSASTAAVLIANSTISGNASWAFLSGDTSIGCIYQPVHISNSTVAFNDASRALYIGASMATIDSSIVANNTDQDVSIAAGLQLAGHNNLIMRSTGTVPADTLNADPMLLPLGDNAGPTWTHGLAASSPAIDAGNNLAGLATDQRGSPFARAFGAKPDIGAFESQPATTAGVSIGPGFTGSWFDPAQSGHGLMLEVLSDHRLLAMWFAFDPQGSEQSWFGGVGTYSGATATIVDVAQPTGGRWIPNFDPGSIVRSPWGTLTFTFTDCNHGRIDFNSGLGYGSGSMNLLRLTQPTGLTCP